MGDFYTKKILKGALFSLIFTIITLVGFSSLILHLQAFSTDNDLAKETSNSDFSLLRSKDSISKIDYWVVSFNGGLKTLSRKAKSKPISKLAVGVNPEVKIPALMYHRINNANAVAKDDAVSYGLRVNPDIFDKQLDQLEKKGYTTVTTEDIYSYMDGKFKLPEKPILLTFDDGFKDNYDEAFPRLKKHHFKGDFALITGVMGTGEYMSWDNAKEMERAGMTFSSHTVFHCYLAAPNSDPKTKANKRFQDSPINDKATDHCPKFIFGGVLNTGQIRNELKESKADLEKNLGINVRALVYPFGNYNQQVMDIAKEAGYSMAFTTEGQGAGMLDLNNPMKLPRTRIFGQQEGGLTGFYAGI